MHVRYELHASIRADSFSRGSVLCTANVTVQRIFPRHLYRVVLIVGEVPPHNYTLHWICILLFCSHLRMVDYFERERSLSELVIL